MSAIGDYVHLKKSNYKTFGIQQNENTEPKIDFAQAAQQAKDRIKTVDNIQSLNTEAKKIEEQLNALFYGIMQQDKDYQSIVQKILEQELINQFGIAVGQVNMSNFSVTPTALMKDIQQALQETRNKTKSLAIKQKLFTNDLNQQISTLEQRLDVTNNNNPWKTVFEAHQELEEMRRQSLNILNQLKEKYQTNAMINGYVELTDTDFNSLKKIINTFDRCPDVHTQEGILFEWVIPLIGYSGSTLALDELKKVMLEANKGTEYVQINFNPDTGEQFQINEKLPNGINVYTRSFRNKVDITLNYDIENERKIANASLKNTGTGKALKASEETSLYTILEFTQEYEFATHFLNLISRTGSSNFDKGAETLSADEKEAIDIVRMFTVKFALEGYVKDNKANLLIINNRAKKHIFVYSIPAIIQGITFLLEESQTKSKFGITTKLIERLNTNYSKYGAESRIADLIQATRAAKVTTKISFNVLDAVEKISWNNLSS